METSSLSELKKLLEILETDFQQIETVAWLDPEKLSLMATFPRFHEMERDHRSIILALRAGIKKRRAGSAEAK